VKVGDALEFAPGEYPRHEGARGRSRKFCYYFGSEDPKRVVGGGVVALRSCSCGTCCRRKSEVRLEGPKHLVSNASRLGPVRIHHFPMRQEWRRRVGLRVARVSVAIRNRKHLEEPPT
jgi:hypothetical protein